MRMARSPPIPRPCKTLAIVAIMGTKVAVSPAITNPATKDAMMASVCLLCRNRVAHPK